MDVSSKRRAEATARSIPGVVAVVNALDTSLALAARVTAALCDDPRTHLAIIDVTAERGIVTLSGEVDSAGVKEAAEEVASQQAGVISVVNALDVSPDEFTPELGFPATLGLVGGYMIGGPGGVRRP
jgi:osmotically-inducible protein OsmY